MTDSLEQERNTLWVSVEELTGVKFINHKEPPEILADYSDEANETIEKLKNVCQRINNRADVRRLSKMMKELNNDGSCASLSKLEWGVRILEE